MNLTTAKRFSFAGSFVGLVMIGLILFSSSAYADRLVLKDGNLIEDLVIESAQYDKVKFKLKGIRSVQERNGEEIDTIVWENATSTFRSGLGFLTKGEYAKAIQRLEVESRTKDKAWSGATAYYLAIAKMRAAGGDSGKLSAAADAIKAYMNDYKKDFYLPAAAESLSACYLAMGDSSKASAALEDLASGKFGKANKLLGKLGQAQIALNKKDYNGSRKLFGEVRDARTTTKNQKALANIGYAKAQLGLGQVKGAMDTIEEKVLSEIKNTGEPAAVASAFIVYGDAEMQKGSKDNQTWAFLRYMRAASVTGTGEIRAEALYKAKEACKKLGWNDKAAALEEELAKHYPNSPWKK